MLPFFDTGHQIGLAMLLLYALLAVTSLSVRLSATSAAPSMLSLQINAWWRIFPVVTLALLTYPFGMIALPMLVCLLAARELAAYHAQASRHRLVIWLVLMATIVSMVILAAFPTLPFGAHQNLAWLFYLFTLTALNDIAQFVFGKLFGRDRIAPRISPNKTWQGLAGGIAVSQLHSLVLGAYLDLASLPILALFGLLLSLAGFAGDLMFSAAKRRLGLKDFSTLIPGHGGILDRVDSLVLTAPSLYCLLRLT